MKHLKTIFACLLMAVLSIGQVWAGDETATIQTTCWGAAAQAYQTDTREFTDEQGNKWHATGYGVTANTAVIIGKGGANYLETPAFSGNISSIEVTWFGNANYYLALQTTDGTELEAKSNTASPGATETFTVSGEYTQLRLVGRRSSGTSNAQATISKVVVTYAGGGSDPVAVTGVSLNKASTSIVEGKTETLVATVAPSNASDKSVSWSSDDESVATVDGGIVTAVAAGTATITVTTTDGSFTDECEVTVTEAPAAVNYELVTNVSELADAAEIIIVNVDEDKALSTTQASKNRPGVAVTSDNHVIAAGDDVQVITLEASSTNWKFNVGDSKYLYASSSSANELKSAVVGTSGNNGVWSIAIADDGAATILAQGSNTRNFLRYNPNSGSPIFNCYANNSTTGTLVKIFKKVDGAVKPSAELAYADAQKLAKVGVAFTAQDLTNPHSVTVSYESGNTGVATVDPATGAVTIVAAGKAVITASFAGNDDYKAGSASYTIFVAEQAGTNEDPLTEASAKALIDDGCTLTVHVNGLVLSQNSTNFTVTLTNGFQFYKAKDLNNVAFESAYLGAGDEVTAVGALKKFSSTYELDEGCYLTFYEQATTPLTPIANDKDHPYTVAQALAFAAAPTTYDLSDHVFIQGVVYKANSFNSDNGTYNIYIKDAGTSEDDGKFEFYKCAGLYQVGEDVVPFAEGDVQEGDEVIGYGVMSYYSGGSIWQFGQPNQLVSLNRPEVAVESVELASTASVAIGKTINLSANVLPANATDKAIAWSIVSGNDKITLDNGAVTGVAEGTAVVRATAHGDNTKYADCTITVEELSVWATTYTNNVAVAHTGSGEDNGTITIGTDDPYKLVKAGASSNTGTIVVTVPVGTTDLHFHAFAWNGKTAKIQLSGVENASQTEFNIAAESGATGSGNDFTLEGDPVDQYFHVSFDAVAAETEITFSKADGSADNRFFFYGVNQVGGLALESIYVSGTASVLEYTDGQHFDPAGLSVIGHYTDDSEAEITEGITWAYDPDPLTEGTESVSVTATAGGFTSAAFVVDGLTVAGAAPLSPWATTWTSNLDDITGSKVKFYGEETEYAALKAGSGGTAGSATLNIPAQATELHLHAYGWNSEDVTLSITAPAGVTVTPASITLNRNSGFASNSPFTLAEGSTPQTDAYYALSLSGNTDAIELTITATEGKRFLLFGVNQVGGVVPVLQGIAISGDLDNKSYKAGQALDMTGLTVMATYTLGGTPQTPVDVTNDPGLSWTYDALEENQEEVTVTAHFGGEEASKTIEGLTVTTADPKIYVSTLNVNFASVEVGESVPAAETVTVTLTNVASVTATLGGTNADAFSVSPASLTESGDITISILANTDAAASYAATLTISDGEGGADDKTVNLSFEVTEPVVEEAPVSTTSKWVLATAIEDGMQVLITGVKADVTYAMGAASSNGNNRTSVAGSLDEGVFTPGENTMPFTLVATGVANTYYIKTSNNQYIYNASTSSKSYLRTKAEQEEVSWTITLDGDNNAVITSVENTNRQIIRFNPNGGNDPLFNCYASGQNDIKLYVPQTPEPPTPVYTEVRTDLTPNAYYTMCLDKAVTAVQGGSIWRVVSKADGSSDIILEEVTGNLDAGRPYIFLASASTLEVAYTGDAVGAPVNDAANNGLIGSFSKQKIDKSDDHYIIYNNALYYVNSNNVYVGANRAYLDMTGVPDYSNANLAPGRRRVTMAAHGPQTATGIEDLNASEKPMKMMINGQIFILRGEKMYDTTGRLVK